MIHIDHVIRMRRVLLIFSVTTFGEIPIFHKQHYDSLPSVNMWVLFWVGNVEF